MRGVVFPERDISTSEGQRPVQSTTAVRSVNNAYIIRTYWAQHGAGREICGIFPPFPSLRSPFPFPLSPFPFPLSPFTVHRSPLTFFLLIICSIYKYYIPLQGNLC